MVGEIDITARTRIEEIEKRLMEAEEEIRQLKKQWHSLYAK